jgi:hypothetical protein
VGLRGPAQAADDLTAARIWGIVHELAAAGLIVLADKGYIGAGDHLITPYRGRGKPCLQKAANSTRAKLRAPAERANLDSREAGVEPASSGAAWHRRWSQAGGAVGAALGFKSSCSRSSMKLQSRIQNTGRQ